MALITAEAAPRPQFGFNFNQENLKDHGRNKFVVGAAVGLAGAVLGNQQIQKLERVLLLQVWQQKGLPICSQPQMVERHQYRNFLAENTYLKRRSTVNLI